MIVVIAWSLSSSAVLGYHHGAESRALGKNDATHSRPLLDPSLIQYSTVVPPASLSVRVSPSMLQGLASRTIRHNCIYRAHPRPVNALVRPVLLPLVSGGYAPAAPSIRHYAQTPPGGQGPGGSGGFPGLKFPMQQQYAKGDALKEFVRVVMGVFRCIFSPILSRIVAVEHRPDRVGKDWKA
jgi:hypothetical protein